MSNRNDDNNTPKPYNPWPDRLLLCAIALFVFPIAIPFILFKK
jgi:hypothetical protein